VYIFPGKLVMLFHQLRQPVAVSAVPLTAVSGITLELGATVPVPVPNFEVSTVGGGFAVSVVVGGASALAVTVVVGFDVSGLGVSPDSAVLGAAGFGRPLGDRCLL
jgi:hypothetical protein